MEKVKNRDWVKNAALIFLSVLLVLTFFSNTIMNRSLPEVATQDVTSGSIVARVRGTGTVTANGSHQVKAEKTRVIRSVLIKSGQKVEAGDVLFTLGEGSSEEIEAAEEKLRSLQSSYRRAATNAPTYSYAAENLRLKQAKEALDAAKIELEAAEQAAAAASPLQEQLEDLQRRIQNTKDELEEKKQIVEEKQKELDDADGNNSALIAQKQTELADLKALAAEEAGTTISGLQTQLTNAQTALTALTAVYGTLEELKTIRDEINAGTYTGTLTLDQVEEQIGKIEAAQKNVDDLTAELQNAQTSGVPTQYDAQIATLEAEIAALISSDTEAAREALREAEEARDLVEANLEQLLADEEVLKKAIESEGTPQSTLYKEKKAAYDEALLNYTSIKESLENSKAADAKNAAAAALEMEDLRQQIETAKKKLDELLGEDSQITAKVAGTVQSIEATAGDTKQKGDILCTIEVPDMGYSLSFSVTNDQANRLRPGDTATVSNFYWGTEIVATLNNIKTDPKNPQTNKLLTFDLTGNVTAGSELTISVGQKSANYDVIIPSSAIRSDANGSFVLKVEAKNSPLGNRYIARRVPVEVLASDDTNSAVTADLSYGDYVITTSNVPVKNGELVRLANA